MWRKYITLGFYIFDDCMDFHRAWKSTAKDAISNRNKIIWNSFHIHRMNDLPVNDNLMHSATTIAKPFLQTNEPDFLLATDIEYEEKNFLASEKQDIADDKNDKSGWKEVSPKKNKRKSPTNSPELTAQTPNQQAEMDHGFTIANMDISDEALLGPPLPETPQSQQSIPT